MTLYVHSELEFGYMICNSNPVSQSYLAYAWLSYIFWLIFNFHPIIAWNRMDNSILHKLKKKNISLFLEEE